MRMEDDSLRCICGKWAKPAKLSIDGLDLVGWKCSVCHEEYLSQESSLRLSAFHKARSSSLEATVTRTGNSLAIRIRKEVADALGLHVGEKLRVAVSPPNKLVLQASGA